jgi:hypothetical protein
MVDEESLPSLLQKALDGVKEAHRDHGTGTGTGRARKGFA